MPREIIVIDNHSEDATKQLVEGQFGEVVYIRTEKNIGVTARNLGLERAKGDLVITLDDDVTGLTDDHIYHLRELFAKRPRLGAANFRIVEPRMGQLTNWVHHCNPAEFSNREFLTYEITEGAVAFRKAALEEVGLYWENFFLSHEGPDLAFRLINNGYDVLYTNAVVVTHHHSSLGRVHWLNYYFDTRNQFWLAARNFPVGYAFLYLLKGLSSMLTYSIRDGYLTYFFRGVLDGLRGTPAALRERNVLNKKAMAAVKRIDSNRPGVLYLIKTRLLTKGVRL